MKKAVFLILSVFVANMEAMAQCAMCKTTIVNNVSHGEISLAEGLNFGIMYLFVTPYLAIIVIGILWYKKSQNHAKQNLKRSTPSL